MQLKRITIQGFKSFAEPVELVFSPGMTAVIGPNGSGKSNLSEAIRWVLGEQSLKSLRGKQSTDVIFSGSTSRGQMRKASVTLTFANESGRFPHQSAEIAIRRIITQEGTSEYLLNGEPTRLIDLQQMLAEAGIGTKSYTVISQGMVDRYLTATPEGRQELFDEATGIKSLQLKLGQAEKKLHRTEAHAHEVQTILDELKPRLTVLERQVRKYEERKAHEQAFTAQQTQWFHHTWHVRNSKVEMLKAQQEAITQRLIAARRERQQAETQLLSAASHSEPGDVLEAQLAQTKAAYKASVEEYARTKALREELVNSHAELQRERKEAEARLKKQRASFGPVAWNKKVRTLLQVTLAFFERLKQGERPTSQEIDQTITQVKEALSHGHETEFEAAREAFHTLEQSIQEVTRLSTLEAERLRQLKSQPVPTPPSKKHIEQLEAALAQTGGTTHISLSHDILERARGEEIELEREGSAVAAAESQARQALQALEQEILREKGTSFLQSIQHMPPTGVRPSVEELRSLAQKLHAIGEPDPLVQKEYEEVAARYRHLEQQMADVEKARQNIQDLYTELQETIHKNFHRQFKVIQTAFTHYFVQLFGGGKAELVQVESGIEISVTPPGKRTRHVTLLSGGEKALTSLALLLAILEAQKPPFIVLDEVDAALDEANSQRLSRVMKENSKHTQSIVITHNRETMSHADVLYGVTMHQDGVSKVYSVKLSELNESPQVEQEKERMAI